MIHNFYSVLTVEMKSENTKKNIFTFYQKKSVFCVVYATRDGLVSATEKIFIGEKRNEKAKTSRFR